MYARTSKDAITVDVPNFVIASAYQNFGKQQLHQATIIRRSYKFFKIGRRRAESSAQEFQTAINSSTAAKSHETQKIRERWSVRRRITQGGGKRF